MNTPARYHLLATATLALLFSLLAVPWAHGQVTIANSGFDTPTVSTFQYRPSGGSWTFLNNAGISNGSWTGSGFGVVGGSDGQFACLQTAPSSSYGSISQNITFPVAGNYTLHCMVAGRSAASQGLGNCTYTISIATTNLSVTGSTTTDQPFTPKSHNFTVSTAGTYNLLIENSSNPSGDNTFYVDTVTVTGPENPFVGGGGNLATGRRQHTATLLPNGKVLVVGGQDENGVYFASAELHDPANGTWTTTGSLASARATHTATLLPNGKVLVAGGSNTSAELYDPASGTWVTTGSLNIQRNFHTATLLANGKVLVAGGNASGSLASAELYDPAFEAWTTTGSLIFARQSHTATLLPNGKVLISAGSGSTGSVPTSAELYDAASGTWTATGSLNTQRLEHTATLLPNGKVLVAGGSSTSTELYNPASGTWTTTGSLATRHSSHTATLLPNGKVLVAGGGSSSPITSAAELYDPATGAWSSTGSLGTARVFHTATLLANGKTLIAGGQNVTVRTQVEIYDYAFGSWSTTGNLNTARRGHTTTSLPNGKVLVTGGLNGSGSLPSAEIYDPASGTWTTTGSLATARRLHAATLLPNGKVLVVGGKNEVGAVLASAELYDPANGTWTATGSLASVRATHTATLLPNGKVLVAGGEGTVSRLASAEVYDLASGTWTATGSLAAVRTSHTATLLPNGKVLVVAGIANTYTASAELYDPSSGTWTTTGSLSVPRFGHSVALLPNGKVLVAAGSTNDGIDGFLATAELYDPASGTWMPTGSLTTARRESRAMLVPNGKVLVVGGWNSSGGSTVVPSTELYDPARGTWTVSGPLTKARYDYTAAVLRSGKLLIAGGTFSGSYLNSAELYDAGLGFSSNWQPQITAVSFNGTGQLVATGTGFNGISGGSGGNTSDSPTNYPVVQLRWLDNGQSVILSRSTTSNPTATAFTSTAGVNTSRYGYALVTVLANGIPSTAAMVLSPLPAPDIAVEQPAGTPLTVNVSTVNYGSVLAGTTSDKVFTLKNPGSANVTGFGITIDGTHASEFSVTANPGALVTPGADTTLTVRFAPSIASGAGTRTAVLHIASNVSGTKNPFSINLSGTATAPEITVFDGSGIGGTERADNSGTHSFGGVTRGDSSAAQTFTLQNTGTANLTGISLSHTGHTADFTLGLPSSTTLAPNASATFTVVFTPTAVGARAAVVNIASNDANENPFRINVAGTGLNATNANLSGLALNVGTLSPVFAAATTSYAADVAYGVTSLTLTPAKAHTAATILVNGTPVTSGSPSGSIPLSVGANAITTVVTAQDGTTTKTYTVTVTRAAGSSNADLSALVVNTATLSPVFAAGTTAYTASVLYTTSSVTVRPTRADANATITVNGVAVISGSASGSIPLNVGANTLTTVVTAQDGTSLKTYTVTVTRAPAAPEIFVRAENGQPIASGSTGVDPLQLTDFNAIVTGSGVIVRAYNIHNIGSAALNLTGAPGAVTVTGSPDFTVTAQPDAQIDAAGLSSFAITFTPTGTGLKTATVSIANDDADESPFTFAISGTALAPAGDFHPGYLWSGNLANLIQGSGGSDLTYGSEFTAVDTSTLTHLGVYDHDQNGLARDTQVGLWDGLSYDLLAITTVTSADPLYGSTRQHALGTPVTLTAGRRYLIGALYSGGGGEPLSSGSAITTDARIQYVGSRWQDWAIGSGITAPTYSASKTVSDAAFIGPAFLLAAPTFPEIAVFTGASTAGANERADNSGTHAFATTLMGGSTAAQTFTIQNTGTAALTGLTLNKTGHTGDFSLGALGAATLAPGATTTFTVTFAPAALGARAAVIQIASNDADENPFRIHVSGTGVSPEIVVEQPLGTDVADGGGRVFGSVEVGGNASLTFTLLDTGTADLTGLTMTKDGAAAADFTVTAMPTTPVGPGGSTTFTVQFTPSAGGARSAVLHIASNDLDENPFDITLSGTGLLRGTLAIGSAVIVIYEEAGTVQIPVTRTGGSDGAVSVLISTTNATASAPGDYTPLTNHVVNFADSDATTKMVPITIKADTLTTEISEAFTVKLTSPAGGATMGAVSTATVKIAEPDLVIPTVSITAPAVNAKIIGGVVDIKGQANDGKGLLKVEVSLNGGAYVEAALTLANPATSLFGTWKLPVTPAAGVNTVTARSVDLRNNVSAVVSRTFSYVSTEAPFLTITPAAGGTVTFTPALVGGKAQIGATYTLKATAKAGYFWHEWTAPGVTGAAAESTSLTFVMTSGMAITANFVTNDFRVGIYTGLAQATGATVPGQNNLGLFSGTLATTGKLTGKVTFGGTATSFVATFDKITGDAAGNNSTVTAAATLSYDLNLDLTGGGEKITGTVTQIASGDVSAVDANRAGFSATNKLSAPYLKPGDSTKNGTYTVVFPSLPEQDGLTSDQYPGGDGFGTVTLTPVGLATLVGTMADGTAVTGSAPLSKLYEWSLAAFVKSTATVTGMTLGGVVKFDPTQANSDLSAEDVQWFRPAREAAAQYPAGWPNGILVYAVGAHYNNALTVQASLGLGSASPTNGQLVFAAGGLTAEVVKTSFGITGSVVTKVIDPVKVDASYTLSVVQSSGAFSGTFTPNWATPIVTKPSFKGIILQKGESQGGYGFFLNNGTGAANKQAGGVTLGAP